MKGSEWQRCRMKNAMECRMENAMECRMGNAMNCRVKETRNEIKNAMKKYAF